MILPWWAFRAKPLSLEQSRCNNLFKCYFMCFSQVVQLFVDLIFFFDQEGIGNYCNISRLCMYFGGWVLIPVKTTGIIPVENHWPETLPVKTTGIKPVRTASIIPVRATGTASCLWFLLVWYQWFSVVRY